MAASIGKTLSASNAFVQRNISSTAVGWLCSGEGNATKNNRAPTGMLEHEQADTAGSEAKDRGLHQRDGTPVFTSKVSCAYTVFSYI